MTHPPPNDDVLADYRWLLTAAAAPLLVQAAQAASELAAAKNLRGCCSAARARLVLETVALRRRARAKFALAGQMFFTRRGLEQASDQWVAAYKAARFPAAGLVADLCCGLGGDLIPLARGRAVRGVDRDALALLLAEANWRACAADRTSGPAPQWLAGPAQPELLAPCAAWHVDPDRRPAGMRTTRVQLHAPGPAEIDACRAVCASAAIKLSPAAVLPPHWHGQAELEWISRDRACRQLVAWFGELASDPGLRRATLLGDDGAVRGSIAGSGPALPEPAPALGPQVLDPDPAVLAADLVGALAARHALGSVCEGSVYLTGTLAGDEPLLAVFDLIDQMPFDVRRIKAWLRARRIGRLEIKKRGVELEPEQLRRQLAVPGDEPGTLLLTRAGPKVWALLARRRSG